jgi:hypothetical protein
MPRVYYSVDSFLMESGTTDDFAFNPDVANKLGQFMSSFLT